MELTMAATDPHFWRAKRVLVTGHTGFKGSWLCLWLQSLGARVHGLALEPSSRPSLFDEARVGQRMSGAIGDIRDYGVVHRAIADCMPEIVIHLAAQPLVRTAYADPLLTYGTNVMGTVNLLEALRRTGCARAVVNVTTDKCYENRDWPWGYRESDALGGHDPYSSSKACSEIVSSAYRRSFLGQDSVALATARAGNVIGGGDWAADRLVPDVLGAFADGRPAVIRHPHAVRPWQHVLEPLSGYLRLAERLYVDGNQWADAWNFGPDEAETRTVEWVVSRMARMWGEDARWRRDEGSHPHEAAQLKLDVSKARAELDWRARWRLMRALECTIAWHRAWLAREDMRAVCLEQIAEFDTSAETN
ncbi:CDP-glucose 4,6-dehydratase [Burkholderia sp. ABCPW 14]|uniref:CDP-glucose 4,6-dehydratase n=1 Tax=Burkholderia sp. ABCPW 14 TaxID=1637860 RepID=UPI000770C60A|nr:CDP-glucose 4,6-dehydratase [Burkholderia sp. ABCPW 14]KVD82481.1 CDP-glucose 4,6-dehydratase [Burkholderia sp. ABCPW 14]